MNLRRKRMILMRDVWYGYNRTASGNPVTLEAAKRLRQLTIYGNAVQSNLPSGYTEVGYIESSGTQYIDTGVCPTNNTKVEVVFSADKNSVFVYGSRTQGNANANHSFCIEGAGVGYFQFGTSLVASSQVISFNSKHTVIISQDGGYFNGELKQSYDTMSFESTVSMYLCGLNYSGSVDSRMFDGKIYSFRVWESGELIQSLVPCKRDSDGAVGMYDTVTGAFLTNSGTGVFTAGAAVTPTPDTPVDIQLCGDRTGNLCPVSKGIEGTTNFSLETPVVEGETYTFSFVADSASEGNTGVGMHLRLNTVSGTVQKNNIYCSIGSRYVGSFTATGSGTLFVNGYWTQSFSQIQVLKGSYTAETLPAYEPYGYKVSGRVEGVNLYNVNDKYKTWNTAVTDDAGWITVNYDNTEGTSGNWPSLYTNFRDVIEPSTEYTIVTEIEYISGCALYPNTTGSPKSAFNILFSYTQQGTHYMTVTSESDLSDCVTLLRSNYLVEPGNIGSAKFRISLLKGSYTADTIPPYEPYQPPQDFAVYLPQQIAKVGDVADEVVVDFEKRTAELVQNIRRLDFTGEEKWDREVKAKNRFYLNASLGLPASRQPAISNRFVTANLSSPQHHDDLTTFAHGTSIYIYYAAMDTIDDFKAFLAANPTYAYVQYATPVTTDITDMQDWDAMPQVKGTVTLTLSAEVPPSGAVVVYYSAERGD